MAVIVRSAAGNAGKMVTCVKAVGPMKVLWPDDKFTVEFMWQVDKQLARMDGRTTDMIADSCLRPIRDQPGDDETLAWAGKPKEIEAPKVKETVE